MSVTPSLFTVVTTIAMMDLLPIYRSRRLRRTTKESSPVEGRGEVVVLSQIGRADDPYARYQDVTMGDLRVAVDYFVAYGA